MSDDGKYCARHFSETEIFLEKYLLSSLTLLGIVGNVVFYVCTFKLKRKPHFYVYIYYLLMCDISATVNFFVWPILYLLWAIPACYLSDTMLGWNKVLKFNPMYEPYVRANMHSFFPKPYFVYVARYHWYFEEILAANANWMTAFIGFDRVFALYRPLSYGQFFTKKKIMLFCMAFTILNAIFSVPYALVLKTTEAKFDTKHSTQNKISSILNDCLNERIKDLQGRSDGRIEDRGPITSHFNDTWVPCYNISEKEDFYNHTYYRLEQSTTKWKSFYDQFYVSLMYLIPLFLSLTCNCIVMKKIYMRRVKVFPALFNGKRRDLAKSARWDLIRKAIYNNDNGNIGINKFCDYPSQTKIAPPLVLLAKCKSVIVSILKPVTDKLRCSRVNISAVNVVMPYSLISPNSSVPCRKLKKLKIGIIAPPLTGVNMNSAREPRDRFYNVVNEYRCREMIRKKFNQYSKQAAIKTSILIMAQSFQIFLFNLPYIIFVFWSGYSWKYSHKESVYNKQLLVHLFKQFNPLLGVYVNLIFDKNIRDIYLKWFKRIYNNCSANIKT
ncbi:unnamed protein product [Gordionus sp. m RMFG-2023]